MWHHLRARFDKLSSEFSTLASPHTTQSTSSEDYPKGVVSAIPSSEYLSLISCTNSEPNSPMQSSTRTSIHAPSCQHWSTRNRMQINTEKTKIMAFFETPALLRARGGQHQPSPTMPPFHVYSHSGFPTSDPRSYPILEVSKFEYLGLILDPKLTMHLATVEAIRRASQGRPLL